jgi:hypothetical protein
MHQFRPSSNKLSISYTAHEATTQKTTAAYQTAMNPCPTTETECNESIASGEVTCSSAASCCSQMGQWEQKQCLGSQTGTSKIYKNNGNLGETPSLSGIKVIVRWC